MEIADAARDILTPLGYEVLELDISGSGKKRRILLRIDRLDEAPVTMEDVSTATQVFSLELDRLDPFEEPYNLEVESPGSNRPLVTERHFERFHDLKAKVKVGRDSFTGVIRKVEGDKVEFEVDGRNKSYKLSDIKARLAEWPDTPR